MSGKWHLRGKGNPDCVPTARGFDEFYGHFRAYASYYRSDLFVRMPAGRSSREYPEGEFYATDAITDHALDFIDQADTQSKPFFLYLAYNAPHFPLQAPKKEIQSCLQQYQQGWDRIREARFGRMQELGIIQGNATLSHRGHVPRVPERNADSPYYDQQIPAWNALTSDRQQDLAKRMATYAAMVQIMDDNVGRVVDRLKELGKLENTLLLFLSDNGACAEWDPLGFDNNPYPKNLLYSGSELETMGANETFHSYGTGWANACNTPFRLYKHYNHEGGISAPMIVHWPQGLNREGEIDRTPAHVIDLAATLLELAGANYPQPDPASSILPLAGQSLVRTWNADEVEERPLFFEHEGNRAVRLGRWKAVWTNYVKQWELYDIKHDRSETVNLAETQPGTVTTLSQLWTEWAKTHFVEPQRVQQPATGMPTIYYWPPR